MNPTPTHRTIFIWGALLLVSLYGVTVLFNFRCLLTSPTTTTVMIPKGASLKSAAHLLKQNDVIRSRFNFRLLGMVLGKSGAIKWGEYELEVPMHPILALRKLVRGHVKQYPLSVPEGFNIAQIGAAIEALGLNSARDFIDYAKSSKAAQELNVPGPTLEGYLFPTTYPLSRNLTVSDICRMMVHEYKEVFTDAWRLRLHERHLSERELVTLASIVEKETGLPEERPLIAAVYHNRLKQRMPLQADPTVIYGITNYQGNITRKHLETYTPYNTYRIRGLPPGPIASPGPAALEASLYPAAVDYLYFVADGTGAHLFSRTYAEHTQNVAKFLKARRRKDRSAKHP